MNAFTIFATAEENRGSKVRETTNKTNKKKERGATKQWSKERERKTKRVRFKISSDLGKP